MPVSLCCFLFPLLNQLSRRPGRRVAIPFDGAAALVGAQCVTCVDHHGNLVRAGRFLLERILHGLRMWAVGKSCRMPGHHTGMYVMPAEELALVVKNDFVVIVVVVEKRYLQRTGI